MAHIALLWAAQAGLVKSNLPVIVPVEILGQFTSSPQPQAIAPAANPVPAQTPPPATPKTPTEPPQKVKKRTQTPVLRPSPPVMAPIAQPDPAAVQTADNAPTTAPSSESVEAAAPSNSASHAATKSSSDNTAQATEQLPSSNASYLQNPKPKYPPLSRRLGEQGVSIVKVLVDVDGTAAQAAIFKSSGFERLDQAAIKAVLSWRYVPGTRNGIAQKMWFNVPINWVLE